MDQKPDNKKSRVGCLIAGLAGFVCVLALVGLAGGAYYFGYFPLQPAPVTAAPATEIIPTEDIPLNTATPEIPAASTDLPQATQTVVSLPPPKVESYDLQFNVQYPTLETLAGDIRDIFILPNQPTILEIHWCAKGESTLSKMTNLLDLTVEINGAEIPVSSFNISKYQTVLQITSEKKDSALCNMLTGIVRNWSEGDYEVTLSLKATAAYNDGWKDHPAGEIQEMSYHVNVAPLSTSAEWGRCEMFEKVKPELVFIDPKPKEPLGFYFKFSDGVPGLETQIASDSDAWNYTAAIGEFSSEKICNFDEGYAGRLYCKVQINSSYSKSVRPVSLYVNGCSWPVYLNPDAEIP